MKEAQPAFETLRFFSQNETMKNVQYMCLFNLLATVSVTKNNNFMNCKVVKGRVTKIQNEKRVWANRQTDVTRSERKPFQLWILHLANCFKADILQESINLQSAHSKITICSQLSSSNTEYANFEVSLKIEASSVLQIGITEILKSIRNVHFAQFFK